MHEQHIAGLIAARALSKGRTMGKIPKINEKELSSKHMSGQMAISIYMEHISTSIHLVFICEQSRPT
eukprot:scaffold85420_cov36-Prasinocladus_malaysianus.AAC.1